MAAAHLERLRLDPERVTLRISFLEAYADMVSRQSKESARDDEHLHLLELDAASSLAEAAQWALLIDASRVPSMLRSAGRLYARRDIPFGDFLLSMVGSTSDLFMSQSGFLIRAIAELHGLGSRDVNVASDRLIPEPLHHPQQQVYLLLAMAGTPGAANEYRQVLRRLLHESPARAGVLPVGALGTPIRRHWAVALELLEGDGYGATARVLEHVTAIARQYSERLELAMVNDYVWANAAAAVDIADLDIAGMVVLAARRFGSDAVREAVRNRDGVVGPLGLVPIEVGLELADTVL